ncbi:FKBP70 [Symbiodinium microadriaticum]|nr:FKBP70 [Symbiodinium sp. KB8]CAE7235653.1 FKBP70 [Symbiodinium microadriaticum]
MALAAAADPFCLKPRIFARAELPRAARKLHGATGALPVAAAGFAWARLCSARRCQRPHNVVVRFAGDALQDDRQDEEEDVLEDGMLMKRVVKQAQEGAPGPLMGDEVTVSYTTALSDGTRVESLESENATFKLGAEEVFRGFDEAVASMRLCLAPSGVLILHRCWGERAVFSVAPDLALGQDGSDEVPPNATLVIDVELLSFVEVEEEDENDFDLDGFGHKDLGPGGEDPNGRYIWERCGEEVLVTHRLAEGLGKADIQHEFMPGRIFMAVKGEVLFAGEPGCEIDEEESFWEIDEDEEGKDLNFGVALCWQQNVVPGHQSSSAH